MPLPANRALRESAAAAMAHRASTIIMITLTFATTLAVFLTAGRSVAVEADVLARIDDAGPRLVTVQVLEPAPGVDQAGLERLSRATGVEWVLGLGTARDTHNAAIPGGANVATRSLLTPMPPTVEMAMGRAPAPGEVIVSASARQSLGLRVASGTIDDQGRLLPVVGEYRMSEDLADLQRLALVGSAPDSTERATLVYLLAESTGSVPVVTAQVQALSGLAASDGVSVSTSDELLVVQEAVGGELSRFGRTMALGSLAAGLVLMALAITLALSSRRRDHGRRRALGASRSAIIVLAVLEVLTCVAVGAVLGAVVGSCLVQRLTGTMPRLDFLVAVPVLVLIIGGVAAVVPATMASLRDPVRILRVP